ncbi:MAG: proline dehydrogenase family protein [Candidatus Aenigmatarchaeota archaeon]
MADIDGKPEQWWIEKSNKWVAGSTIIETIRTINKYNKKGYRIIVNSINAVSNDSVSIEKVKNNYTELIKKISENKCNAGITIRASNLGIGYSYKEAKRALQEVLETSKKLKVSVEMDIEEREFVEDTIKIASEMLEQGYSFRMCMQAALKNARKYLEQLIKSAKKGKSNITFRIVTGSCYPKTKELSEENTVKQFYELMDLKKGSAIGSHVIDRVLSANNKKIEAQVLMGFENTAAGKLANTLYAPFGDWRTNEGIRGYIQRREGI